MKQLQQNQLAYTSKWPWSKKSLYEWKQQPHSTSTKYEKTFHVKIVIHLSTVINLYFRISPRIFVKIWNGPYGVLKGPGKQIHEKRGPSMTKLGVSFFYIKQTRMVRWLGDWRKKLLLFLFGEDIHHFVFLANAEHTLKIIKRMISVRLKFFSVCSA